MHSFAYSYLNSFIIKFKYMHTRHHYSPCCTPEQPQNHQSAHKNQSITPFSNKTPLSFSKQHSIQMSPSGSHERKQTSHSKPFTPPFVSVYGRETRFEQVMKLKARPVTASRDGVEALLTLKQKSQVALRQEPNRFQKIMALKVQKPTVVSTLANYQPKVTQRRVKQKENRPPPQESLWQCQQQCKREEQAEERAHRQWLQEERQRQIQLQRKRKESEKEEASRRRKQAQFQSLVQKQVRKIERQRELSQRKNGGFAIYIYPQC